MTWNIQWGRGVSSTGPRSVDLSATIARIRRWSPDVICLQEVCVNFPANTDERYEDQLALLQAAFPEFQLVFAPTTDWYDGRSRQRFGNVLLSRYALLCSRAHLLPSPPDAQAVHPLSVRSAVEAWIDTPEGVCRVICTHLEYGSAMQRRAQIEYLVSLGDAASARAATHDWSSLPAGKRTPVSTLPRERTTFILGDFNAPPTSPEFAALTDAGYCDLWQVIHGPEPHAPTISVHHRARPEYSPVCYDYVFVTREWVRCVAEMVVDMAATESDHQPLIIKCMSVSDRLGPFAVTERIGHPERR